MDKNKIINPFIFFIIIPIKFYQYFISPLSSSNCRFYPTCSQYCIESLRNFGLFKGTFFCFFRILKCHPFGGSGYDPVKNKFFLRKITLPEIQKFREKNLYSDLPKNLASYKKDNDKTTLHYGLFHNKNLVSGLTLISENKIDSKRCQIRGMFTVKKYERMGYGSLLIKLLLSELRSRKVNQVWCNSRISAVDFYKKNKFKKVGKIFNIVKIGKHLKMIKNIYEEKKSN